MPLNMHTPGLLQALGRGQPCPEALPGQAPRHHSWCWRSWPGQPPQRLLLLMPLHLPERLPLCAHDRRHRLRTAAARSGHFSATQEEAARLQAAGQETTTACTWRAVQASGCRQLWAPQGCISET